MTTPQVPSPHRLRRPLTITGIVVLVLMVVAAAAWLTINLQSSPFSFEKTLAAGSTVRVNAADVRVGLHPARDGQVHVHAHGGYRGSQPRITARPEAGGVVVEASCDTAGLSSCDLSVDVDLPVTNAASVVDTNDAVSAESLTGSVSLVTTNGEIKASDLAGDLTMRTENGEITADRLRSATVTATSSNGEESLRFANVPTTVTAHTSNGDITVTVPGSASYHVEPETTNGDVNLSIPKNDSAGHVITATTTNGDITVRQP